MTKFKSQNEVDMEEGKGSFWVAMGLLVITLLALYGVWDVVSKIFTRS